MTQIEIQAPTQNVRARLQGGCEPRPADRTGIFGMVQQAGRRTISVPDRPPQLCQNAIRAQPHADCGNRGDPCRSKPRRCRTAVVDAPGVGQAGRSDALEFRPTGEPGRRTGRLSAPASGAACRHQSAVRPDLAPRRTDEDAGDRGRAHRNCAPSPARTMAASSTTNWSRRCRRLPATAPATRAGKFLACSTGRPASTIPMPTSRRTRRRSMPPIAMSSSSWSTTSIRSRPASCQTVRPISFSGGSIAGIRKSAPRRSESPASISAPCVRTAICGAWRISRRSPSGIPNMRPRAFAYEAEPALIQFAELLAHAFRQWHQGGAGTDRRPR